MQRKNSRNLISLVERKSDEKSVIEGERPDGGTSINVETVETVVHEKDEREKIKP